jgi:hypothetical protein
MDPAPPRKFVEVWQTAEDIAEVVRKLHMTRAAVRTRAFRYRQRGIPLKDLPAGDCFAWIDWEELAQFAKECGEQPPGKKPATAPA